MSLSDKLLKGVSKYSEHQHKKDVKQASRYAQSFRVLGSVPVEALLAGEN